MSVVLHLLAEPVMLSCFGTTPGKFLFGLRVTAESGAHLTWKEAYYRTWTVLKKGCGFHIPVYYIIREYISYKACKKGEYLEWENDSVLWLSEKYVKIKAAAAVLVVIGLNGLFFLVWQAGALPQNKGDVSYLYAGGVFTSDTSAYSSLLQDQGSSGRLPEFYNYGSRSYSESYV